MANIKDATIKYKDKTVGAVKKNKFTIMGFLMLASPVFTEIKSTVHDAANIMQNVRMDRDSNMNAHIQIAFSDLQDSVENLNNRLIKCEDFITTITQLNPTLKTK